jgi:hypothetical protein
LLPFFRRAIPGAIAERHRRRHNADRVRTTFDFLDILLLDPTGHRAPPKKLFDTDWQRPEAMLVITGSGVHHDAVAEASRRKHSHAFIPTRRAGRRAELEAPPPGGADGR